MFLKVALVVLRALRKKIWSEFHRVRIGGLPKLWRDLCSNHDELPRLSPHVQDVNQRLHASIIKSPLGQNSRSSLRSVDVPQLTTDEESIIRYAAGYVPFKLLKEYEKCSSDVAVSAVECLLSMVRRAVYWNTLPSGLHW